ncbi:MAG: hypothetical protein ABJH05_07285 [Fulvivirga sp.]
MRRKIYIIVFVFIVGLFACNSANYTTVRHVKPNNYNRAYNPAKDKRKKRVKYVKKKILKRSKAVKVPKQRKPKNKEVVQDSVSVEELKPPTNEPDSTGSF